MAGESTLTFLFTDIEGSTRYWERQPEAMRVALRRHNDILRDTIEKSGGRIFQTAGDAFHASFTTAPAALRAAVQAQQALFHEPWKLESPLRVRMVLHTGEAGTMEEEYTGPVLNRMGRMLQVCYGQQTILSMATEELVRGRLPEGVSLLDLGQHRFRDLAGPEHIFQAVIPGLPAEFPPLSSLVPFGGEGAGRSTPIRLLIVDDHTLFREGMKALLATTDDIEVVGEAGDGNSALAQIQALKPDIVLMDINMPGLNGIQATQQVLAARPETGIIMITMLEDDASVFAAMRAGARGYLLKGANPVEMLHVIRAVAEGQALFGPAIASRLMRYFQELGAAHVSPLAEAPFPELSDREVEVLRLISQGHNNAEIAQKLVISPKTVRNHITNIFSKLQVADRAQAIVRARQAGLQ